MSAGECWRGIGSGAPVIARTCRSNCERSQAVDAVVARVVRPRRHLVGDQRAVVEDEELDAQDADVVERGDDAPGERNRLGLLRSCRRRPRPAARASPRGCPRDGCSPAPADARPLRRAPRATMTLSSAASGRLRSSTQSSRRALRTPRPARRGSRPGAGPCRRSRGARSSGCRAAVRRRRRSSAAASAITACGAQATPQRANRRLLGRRGPGRSPPRPPPARPAGAAASVSSAAAGNVLELGRDARRSARRARASAAGSRYAGLDVLVGDAAGRARRVRVEHDRLDSPCCWAAWTNMRPSWPPPRTPSTAPGAIAASPGAASAARPRLTSARPLIARAAAVWRAR